MTGDAPLALSVSGLPRGLKFDRATGIISGSVSSSGDHAFTVKASNKAGKTEARYHIVAGDALALTPPMGWNSYDAFGDSVYETEVLSNAALAQNPSPTRRLGHRRGGFSVVRQQGRRHSRAKPRGRLY